MLTNLIDKLPFVEANHQSLLPTWSTHRCYRVITKTNTQADSLIWMILSLLLQKLIFIPLTHGHWLPRLITIVRMRRFLNRDYLAALNMAKTVLRWLGFTIDGIFTRRNSSLTPAHIKNDPEQLSNHLVREVLEREIFPKREAYYGLPTTIPVLNISFYPNER